MKIIFSFCLICIFFSVQAQKEPEENFMKGIVFLEQEKYDSAIHFFTLSSGIKKSSDIFYYRGMAYFRTNQLTEALQDFLKVEESDKGKAAFLISRIYAKQNDIKNMLVYLEHNLKSRYKKPESEIMLDKDLSKFENNKEWIQFWKESNHFTPYDHTVAKAKYLFKAGKNIDALNILSEGIKNGYRPSPLKALRADIYISLKDYKLALSDLNDAIKGDNRNPELYFLRGKVNLELKNHSEAIEDFSTVLRYSPERIDVFSMRAMSYHYSGNYTNAVEDMNYYLSFYPEDDKALYDFAFIHNENGKYFDALRSLNKALTINRSEPEYFILRGKTYFQTNTNKYARNDFSMALDLEPKNANAYLMKGKTALRLGLQDEACFCFKRAFELGIFEAKELFEKNCKQE